MTPRRALGVVVGAVALAALGASLSAVTATGAHAPGRSSIASALCRDALGPDVLNAARTTVRTVRAVRYGPDYAPAPDAFASTAPGAVAAWCWTGGPGAYRLFAVAGGHAPVRIESVATGSAPRPGPAPIP